MKSTLRFLLPTLLAVAACGGGGGGDDMSGDDGPGLTCAMATATVAVGSSVDGNVKGAGADVTATEDSCTDQNSYYEPDGEDQVVELTGLTAGKKYGVRVTSEDDLSVYITSDCPMGGAVTNCSAFSDSGVTGDPETVAFTATGATAFAVVDYNTGGLPDPDDPTSIGGPFTINVVEAQCSIDSEDTDCSGATPRCGDDFQCHQCASELDCSGATPICGSALTCVAGPALCVNDDPNDSGNGDDGANNATMIATPTAGTPTTVSGRICSSDGNEADWYKVTLSSDVGITLSMDNSVDLDVILFDSSFQEVASAETAANPETILTDGDITASGTYYILVVPYVSDESDRTTTTTAYTLRLNIPTCDPSEFVSTTCTTAAAPTCTGAGECLAGTSQCTGDDAGDNTGGDDSPGAARALGASTTAAVCNVPRSEADWYKFTAAAGAGETVTLNWTGAADLDLYVYDSEGTIYGASLYKQPEVVTLTQLPAGTYYARVVNTSTTAAAAAVSYTIGGAATAAVGCTTATSCASEYKTQVFRGSCATATGVCSFLAGNGAAGAACDGGSNPCDDDDQCSYQLFQSNGQNAKCVSADGCTTDADCSGGFKCTKDFTVDFLGQTFDVNFCKEACTTNTDCGANTGDDTLDTNLPWNYNTCAPATGVCTFDPGA
jgi:hypothetical protein